MQSRPINWKNNSFAAALKLSNRPLLPSLQRSMLIIVVFICSYSLTTSAATLSQPTLILPHEGEIYSSDLLYKIKELNIMGRDCFLKSMYFADTGRLIPPSKGVKHFGNTEAEQVALTEYVIRNWSSEKIYDFFYSQWKSSPLHIRKHLGGEKQVFKYSKKRYKETEVKNARELVALWLKRSGQLEPQPGIYVLDFTRMDHTAHTMNVYLFRQKSDRPAVRWDYFFGIIDNQAEANEEPWKEGDMLLARIYEGSVEIAQPTVILGAKDEGPQDLLALRFKSNRASSETGYVAISEGMLATGWESQSLGEMAGGGQLFHLDIRDGGQYANLSCEDPFVIGPAGIASFQN